MLAADFISPSLTHLFNLSFACNEILISKTAFVLLLLKAGDPTLLNDQRTNSQQCWQRFWNCSFLTTFLSFFSNTILSENQSGIFGEQIEVSVRNIQYVCRLYVDFAALQI